MHRHLSILAAATLLAGGIAAQCQQLAYNGTSNGQKGTMFEIANLSASNPLNIGYFEQAFLGAGTADIEIYTIAGSCAGLESTPGAWTLIGSATGVVHTASPNFDLIPISIGITIPPSGVQSFYITCTNNTPSNVYYTSGVSQYGVQYASNADLALVGRTGMSYPFGSSFGLPTAGRLWNGRVNYGPACSGSFAAASSIGTGCTSAYASIYENNTTAFDLSNTSLNFQWLGNGYAVLPGTAAIAPQTSAPVAMGDDQVLTFPLGFSMPFAGGTTTDVWVSSNGFINLTTNALNGCCSFNLSQFLSNGPSFAAKWRDLNPSAGGTVQFDSDPVNGLAYVTFTGVPDFGATNTNDFQYVLSQTGAVELRFGNVAPTAGGTGYSPGSANADPGSTDLSALTAAVTSATDVVPLSIAIDARPIVSTTVNLTTANITPTTPFGAVLLGLNNPNLDLTSAGMPTCTQYTDGLITLLFLPLGSPTVSTPFAVPALSGLNVFAQSVVFDPTSGRTPLGAIASNGIQMLTGSL